MKRSILLAALVFVVLGFSMPVWATSVTVEDNLANNMLINRGDIVTGQFNINPPALPNDGNYNAPYNVTNATATFRFADDGDFALSSSQTITTYSNWGTCNGDQVRVQNVYNYYVDAYEQVQLSVGTQISVNGTSPYSLQLAGSSTTANGGTTSHSHSYNYPTTCYDSWGHAYSCTGTGWYTDYVTTYYTTNTSNSIDGYRGELTITVPFGLGNIQDLSLDGQVTFTVTGTDGDIIFNDGTLTANVEPNPRTNPDPNAVPEPATLLLLALGLAGAVGFARNRKK